MQTTDILQKATGGRSHVAKDWMPATGTRSSVLEDPILLWLDCYGEAHGFNRDSSPYEFSEFIFKKGMQFEKKWISELAPEAVRVCSNSSEANNVEKFRASLELIQDEATVIAAPALWWAPERIYGVPDLLIKLSWLRENFPEIGVAAGSVDRYVVVDLKFTTKLDSTKKSLSLAQYSAQVRIYSYIIGRITGQLADEALLFCRDRVRDPISIPIRSDPDGALDSDLATIRDSYLDIKLNGERYRPGIDVEIAINPSNKQDEPWHSVKSTILREFVPGGDPCVVYHIGRTQRRELADRGFGSLEALLKSEPDQIPLEACSGLGAAKCPVIRAMLRANREGVVTPDTLSGVPSSRAFEFCVDFETFNNLNVDFSTDWPSLVGREMIFMIGIGWTESDNWCFEVFTARAEDAESESELLEEFAAFLDSKTRGQISDGSKAALYHWSNAEVWQLRRACDRHGLNSEHVLRSLPWVDLEKELFRPNFVAVPGAWGYGLKEIATGLDVIRWPGDLDSGLRASVAAWKAYEAETPLQSSHMRIVTEYNEVDCRAVDELLRWARTRTN